MNKVQAHPGQPLGLVRDVRIGQARPYTRPGIASAIDKQRVSGPVFAGPLGLQGDEQGDRQFHGGPDKAIHLYATEHYKHWRDALGEHPLLQQSGAFGENLATQGVSEWTLCLGDRLQVGQVVLEITQGRQPCWKLNDRFAVTDMARRLQDTLMTGWYCRVLTPGELSAGDAIILRERPYPQWTIARLMAVLYEPVMERATLESVLELALVANWRTLVEKRLQTGRVEDWTRRLEGPLQTA